MADEASAMETMSCQVTGDSSESTIEINIKTLDSKIYTFRVNKDMPVPKLKEKLVDVSGVPVERQRLIFRGKVLKDDHLLSEYHLEDGHTLHLVARQPTEGQSSSGTVPGGTSQDNNSQGIDPMPGAPRNRIGQVSHSVLLGTVNVADQGESLVADIGRLVGAVLSSLGVGNGAPTVSASGPPSATASNQAPSSAEAERSQNTSGSPVSGSPPSPVTFLNQPFQSLHQIPQLPSTVFPPRHMTIPDSLTTLSEFISRMELALQNGGSQTSPSNLHDPLRTESPSSLTRGLPTPEMLRAVMEQAQQLLSGNATAALSRVASRLEREGTSTDTVVRGQIQAEAMHVGAAMQHLGSLLLELGRAMMMLRMGQSPADSIVNAGPAVYISPAGPNPIMVQPSPLQTNSLFGVSAPPFIGGTSGPVPIGDPSRNINIHIHAGNPFIPGVSNAAARANSGEATHGERSNGQQASRNDNSTGDSAPPRGVPPRTVVAAIPARSTAQTSSHVLSVIYPVHVRSQLSVPTHSAPPQVSNPTVSSGAQPTYTLPQSSSESGTLSNIAAQISAQVANALSSGVQGLSSLSQGGQSTDAQGSQTQSGTASHVDQTHAEANALSGNAQGHSSSPNMQSADLSFIGERPQQSPSDLAQDDGKGDAGNADAGERESIASVIPNVSGVGMPRSEGQEVPQESSYAFNNLGSIGGSSVDTNSSVTTSRGGLPVCQRGEVSNDKLYENNSDFIATNRPVQSGQSNDSDKPTPLGLGLGGLQPKRRGKMAKPVGKDKVSDETLSVNQDQQSIARGQQFLNSLLSENPSGDGPNTNDPSSAQTSLVGQIMDGLSLGTQGTNGQGQVDAADMMSHILRTPAFNNILTGVAEHTGIGSSDDLRSMLEQCTQTPAVRNTLNDIAQQVQGQNQSGETLFSGVGSGQSGLDFSRMIQQMMPAVSQALGRGSTRSTPSHGLQTTCQTEGNDGRSRRDDVLHERNSLVNLEHAVERIEQHDAPGNIFRSVLENAGHLVLEGNGLNDVVNTLVNNEELTNEFMSMLRRDLHHRMQTDSTSGQ